MSGFGSVLLGTSLAKSPGVQAAVDLTALVAVVVVMAVIGVTNLVVWIALPAVVLVSAVVRVSIVRARARSR